MYIDMVRHHVVNAGGRLVRSLVCRDGGAQQLDDVGLGVGVKVGVKVGVGWTLFERSS